MQYLQDWLGMQIFFACLHQGPDMPRAAPMR